MTPTDCAPDAAAALTITIVQEDAVTRRWAQQLWSRVGRLTGNGGICRECWNLAELVEKGVFEAAVRSAAKADVLVIAVRDAEPVPLLLRMWLDAWPSQREGRPGAMVALIGVDAPPHREAGRVHRLLEQVAGKAGLEFLPRERKLPPEPEPVPRHINKARGGRRLELAA